MSLNSITVSRTNKKQNSRITNNIAVKDFSSVHMNKAEQLYTTNPAVGWRIPYHYSIVFRNTPPRKYAPHIFLQTFQLGQYLPNDLRCPILWLQTIIPLIWNYIFSRKHSQSLEIKEKVLKKTQSKTMVQRLAQLLWLHPSKIHAAYQQMIILLCFKRNEVSSLFPSNPVNAVQDCQSPRCWPCWLHSFDISFANCLLQPFSCELEQERQKKDVLLY